jgi:chorismate dehydratase
MSTPIPSDPGLTANPWRIGCVSYINAKPLIQGLQDQLGVAVHFDVPSRLLDSLLDGQVDIALCPVIDYFRNQNRLAVVPAGGICSAGQTFTVRLYSKTPLEKITQVHVDADSHTSIVLLQVLLYDLFQIRPELVPYHAKQKIDAHHPLIDAPAMLLIGDKVVTDGPSTLDYPHQLDLGQSWNKLTGLPFVFATWLTMINQPLGDLPAKLVQQREINDPIRDEIAHQYASVHHWPADLARRYLCDLLHYKIGDAEIAAMELFASKAHKLGLVPAPAPVLLRSMV